MHPALVRLSTVVALTVPLAVHPVLADAPPGLATVTSTVLAVRLVADSPPPADDPAAPPPHDMDQMDGTQEMDGDDHDDPWAVEHSHDDAPSDEHAPVAPDRPRVEVLSAFGALNGAVLVSAALLRRRARNRPRHRPRAVTDPSATDRRRTTR